MTDRKANHDATSWIFTADRRGARLLCCETTPHGRLHIEERAKIEEEWDERQHGRSSPLTGRSGHSNASFGHEREERLRRFAKTVADFLEREIVRQGCERVHAFVSRRLLGELRRELSSEIGGRVVEHARDLGNLTPAELSEHALVARVHAEELERAS